MHQSSTTFAWSIRSMSSSFLRSFATTGLLPECRRAWNRRPCCSTELAVAACSSSSSWVPSRASAPLMRPPTVLTCTARSEPAPVSTSRMGSGTSPSMSRMSLLRPCSLARSAKVPSASRPLRLRASSTSHGVMYGSTLLLSGRLMRDCRKWLCASLSHSSPPRFSFPSSQMTLRTPAAVPRNRHLRASGTTRTSPAASAAGSRRLPRRTG
mmetsp:Transcript_110822/g.357718  ORF Transcript_110822/g.357718 Transcript_110822/m.357718 type:complete len:211 (+) Transcript_110822:309-941(+)